MSMRDRLYSFYWRLEKKIVPGHTSSQNIYARELKQFLPRQPVWLDLGCGHQLLPNWLAAEEAELLRSSRQLVGIDLDRPSLIKHTGLRDKIEGGLSSLPFRNGVFDLVTANMVVEHLADPAAMLQEIRRILKPGGLFIFHTPNYLNCKIIVSSLIPQFLKNRLIHFFDQRPAEDVFPTFYRLNTPGRVRRYCTQTGFELASLTLTDTSALTVMLGPVVIVELLWFKVCRLEGLASLRSNIIAVFRKA